MSTRDVFHVSDPVTLDGVAVGLDERGALVVRALFAEGERVVVVTEPGAARRLAHALLEHLGERAA